MTDLTEASNYIKSNILPNVDKIINYNCAIIGCIGCGKTTILKNLIELFKELKPNIINEYLEADKNLGPLMLSGFINKTISPLTFQSVILDICENEMKKINKNVDKNISKITFYERIPDDNLAIFTNLSFKNKELSEKEFEVIYSRTIELDNKFNIPSYLNKNAKFKKIVSTDILDSILIILQTIYNDIMTGVKNRIIGLSVSLEICKLRIKRRNRENENKYSDEYLESIIKAYENIYNVISNDNYNINLFNIGKFVE